MWATVFILPYSNTTSRVRENSGIESSLKLRCNEATGAVLITLKNQNKKEKKLIISHWNKHGPHNPVLFPAQGCYFIEMSGN